MKSVAIERKCSVDVGEFRRLQVQNGGCPVIVTDAIGAWDACSRWSLERFASVYGTDFATASRGLYAEAAKLTTVGEFVRGMRSGIEPAGFWVDQRSRRPLRASPNGEDGNPLYLLGWPAFRMHPELQREIQPAPYFIDDWVLDLTIEQRALCEELGGREFWSIYVGPRGTVSELHQDFWGTHAYLAQVRGRKSVRMHSPNGAGGESLAHVGEIVPGDVLFIPRAWWHCVRAEEESITLSHNFFNAANFREYGAALIRALDARKARDSEGAVEAGLRAQLARMWLSVDPEPSRAQG